MDLMEKKIIRYDGIIEEYDEPILTKDIRGEFPGHIKIQYFNND